MANSDFRANVDLLKSAAVALGPLLDKVAFVGGATTILHFTEKIRDVRATLDVDVIVDMTRAEFQQAEEELRALGFQPDPRLICRHKKGDPLQRSWRRSMEEAGATTFGQHSKSREFRSALEGNMPRDSTTTAERILTDLRELAAEA